MNVLIYDDDPASMKQLSQSISEYCPSLKVVACVSHFSEFQSIIDKEAVEILFLDVQMPGLSGFEVLQSTTLKGVSVVLISAHEKYAIEGYGYNVKYFLVKPIAPKALMDAVSKCESSAEDNGKDLLARSLCVFSGKDYLVIPHEEIVRVEAEGSYSRIVLQQRQPELVSYALGRLEEALASESFIRCHRSHIVNLKHIYKFSKMNNGLLILSNGDTVPTSRKSKKWFEQALVGK